MSTELISALYSTSSTLPGPFQELNESFVLGSAFMVFFMHTGFAMVSVSTAVTHSLLLVLRAVMSWELIR